MGIIAEFCDNTLFFTMTKTTIHIFGNPLLPFDNLPIKLSPKLKKRFPNIDFIIQDPNENLKPKNKELIIIDTVLGVKKVTVINDIDKIQLEKTYSAHDFDLGFNLKLLQKIGELKKVAIFGIPPNIKEGEALKQLAVLLDKFLHRDRILRGKILPRRNLFPLNQ